MQCDLIAVPRRDAQLMMMEGGINHFRDLLNPVSRAAAINMADSRGAKPDQSALEIWTLHQNPAIDYRLWRCMGHFFARLLSGPGTGVSGQAHC